MNYKNIPSELAACHQWVGWSFRNRNGKAVKMPVDPNAETFTPAKVNDPSTWGSLEDATAAVKRLDLDGVGFVFTKEDPYVGIDLDHCRDPETGSIKKWANQIVDKMNSYTEISPSETGLHIIVLGEVPGEKNHKGEQVEVYSHSRFFTFTGNLLKRRK